MFCVMEYGANHINIPKPGYAAGLNSGDAVGMFITKEMVNILLCKFSKIT